MLKPAERAASITVVPAGTVTGILLILSVTIFCSISAALPYCLLMASKRQWSIHAPHLMHLAWLMM